MSHSYSSGIQIALWEEYCHEIFIIVIVFDDCSIFGEGDVRDLFLLSVRWKSSWNRVGCCRGWRRDMRTLSKGWRGWHRRSSRVSSAISGGRHSGYLVSLSLARIS